MSWRSDCRLLAPVLVARAFGEPHPEDGRLTAHLGLCGGCRDELRRIEETREEIEPFFEASSQGPGLPSSGARMGSWLLSTVPVGVAAGFLLCGGGLGLRAWLGAHAPAAHVAALMEEAGPGSPVEGATYFGYELDVRIADLGAGVSLAWKQLEEW